MITAIIMGFFKVSLFIIGLSYLTMSNLFMGLLFIIGALIVIRTRQR